MAIKFRTNEDYVTAIDVLNSCAKIFQGWADEEYNILVEARRIIEREYDIQLDEQAHSDVTLEIENSDEIPLIEWARIHGIDESFARSKARRGGFKSAHKVGRDWMILRSEANVDNRRKR